MSENIIHGDYQKGYRRGFIDGQESAYILVVKILENKLGNQYKVITQEQYDKLKSLIQEYQVLPRENE